MNIQITESLNLEKPWSPRIPPELPSPALNQHPPVPPPWDFCWDPQVFHGAEGPTHSLELRVCPHVHEGPHEVFNLLLITPIPSSHRNPESDSFRTPEALIDEPTKKIHWENESSQKETLWPILKISVDFWSVLISETQYSRIALMGFFLVTAKLSSLNDFPLNGKAL